MTQRTTIAKIYEDLYNAVSNVESGLSVFLGERPTFSRSGEPLNKFAVIELPVAIRDIAFGKNKFMLYTTGVIYLFTKAKNDNTLNVNAYSDFAESVVDLFPISGTYCVASNPEVQGRGADGNGYQVVTITFDLHTKSLTTQNS